MRIRIPAPATIIASIALVAALSGTAGVIVYYLIFGQAGLPYVLVMAALVTLKHHANIRRLLAGQESRIGAKP